MIIKFVFLDIQASNRQWKWFDKRNGKWINYTLLNNKLIDDAYKLGKNHLKITENRTSYTISLRNMIQVLLFYFIFLQI